MSSGPVARWLDTFVFNSKQYAEIFKKFGFDTLNEVCKLDQNQLAKMGINQIDSEKIIENVSVLRQTLQVNVSNYNTHEVVLNQKTSKAKKVKNSDNNNNKQKQITPNVVINQGLVQNQVYNGNNSKANHENARKIGNEILQMTNNANSRYTCVPIQSNNFSYYQQQQQQQQQLPPNQQYRPNQSYYNSQQYYGNSNWNQDYSSSSQYYSNNTNNSNNTSSHSNEFYPKTVNTSNNNSPLEYLEKLALLPECQVVDPKSIVNENQADYSEEFNSKNLKRNIIEDNLSSNQSKKICSNSNSPNFKQQQYLNNQQQQQQQQQRYLNTSSDSPSSSCSSSSSSQPSNSNQTELGSANLIDTCNFDFLDYLPELNSNTIDQTITASNEQNNYYDSNHQFYYQ